MKPLVAGTILAAAALAFWRVLICSSPAAVPTRAPEATETNAMASAAPPNQTSTKTANEAAAAGDGDGDGNGDGDATADEAAAAAAGDGDGDATADQAGDGDNNGDGDATADAAAAGAGDEGDDALPPARYRRCFGDALAAERWAETRRWRAANGIERLLREPQPHALLMRRAYPHFIYGTPSARQSETVIYFERPGGADFGLLRRAGVSFDELIRYYVFMTEYLWTVLEPRPDARLVSVWDMRGVAVREFRGWRRRFFDEANRLMTLHYPDRTERLFVVNAPRGISLVLGVATRFMPPWTRSRIVVSTDCAPLLAYVGAARLPLEFGGTCETPLGESELDVAYARFIEQGGLNAPPPPPTTTTARA